MNETTFAWTICVLGSVIGVCPFQGRSAVCTCNRIQVLSIDMYDWGVTGNWAEYVCIEFQPNRIWSLDECLSGIDALCLDQPVTDMCTGFEGLSMQLCDRALLG